MGTEDEVQDGATDKVVEPADAPALRIITPDTTPEEVAAIVAVLSAMGGGAPAPEPPRSLWAAQSRATRVSPGATLAAGRGAWRASGLPR